MERYKKKYLNETDIFNAETEEEPQLVLTPQLQKLLYRYFLSGNVPSSRARIATDVMLDLIHHLIEIKYDTSKARVLDKFLDQFYKRID